MFSFGGGALCHDAGYIELTVSQSGREHVKARPHRKLIGLLSKTEQSGCFLSLTHALHGQSHRHTHTPSLLLVRALHDRSHTCSHRSAHSCSLALHSGRLYLICGCAGAAINMWETPGTSGKVGMSVMMT